MKSKTVYLLLLICTISLFSAAKQSGKDCASSCTVKKTQRVEPARPETGKTSFELAPLAWLL